MSNGEWSAQVRWDEACARSSGRRRINAIRKIEALVRQQAILRRLRERGDFTRCGVQRQLAHEFDVSASVICRDLRRLFVHTAASPAQARRVPRPREVHRKMMELLDRDRLTPQSAAEIVMSQAEMSDTLYRAVQNLISPSRGREESPRR